MEGCRPGVGVLTFLETADCAEPGQHSKGGAALLGPLGDMTALLRVNETFQRHASGGVEGGRSDMWLCGSKDSQPRAPPPIQEPPCAPGCSFPPNTPRSSLIIPHPLVLSPPPSVCFLKTGTPAEKSSCPSPMASARCPTRPMTHGLKDLREREPEAIGQLHLIHG